MPQHPAFDHANPNIAPPHGYPGDPNQRGPYPHPQGPNQGDWNMPPPHYQDPYGRAGPPAPHGGYNGPMGHPPTFDMYGNPMPPMNLPPQPNMGGERIGYHYHS